MCALTLLLLRTPTHTRASKIDVNRLCAQATERSGIASAATSFKENLRADDGAPYDEIIEIDLDKLRPHVNGPFTPDLAHPVGAEFTSAVKVSITFTDSEE